MKVYIAGRLTNKTERERLEEVDILCKKLGFKTFLPHRDVGLAEDISDAKKIFKGDIEDSLSKCDLVLAVLEGLHVGAGTAWELGYAYAKGIPSVGIKTDESIEEALPYLSAILIHSMPILNSDKKLKDFLINFNKKIIFFI